jgi:hypothetical protein
MSSTLGKSLAVMGLALKKISAFISSALEKAQPS